MSRRSPYLRALPWALLIAGGCTRDPAVETPPAAAEAGAAADPQAIALFDDGEVTASQLDRAVLSLPRSARHSLTTGGPEGYREMVRELAVDAILLREARALGLERSAEFQNQLRALRRNAFVERYLEAELPRLPPPSEEEIRREHERRSEAYHRPERRLVSNIFLRLEPGKTREELRTELGQLREEILSGQSFADVAERVSDSESRHHRGRLGWIERGQLSPDLDAVIFSLREGVPSEVIATRDGVHLFVVDTAIEARDLTLDEVRRSLAAELFAQRRSQAMRGIEEAVEVDVEVFSPQPEELRTLEQRGDPNSLVLRVGDFELRYRDFRLLLEIDRQQNPGAVEQRRERLLEALRQGELIYQHQLALGATLDAERERRLAAQSERALAFSYRRQKVQDLATADPARLRSFFEDNRWRFASPLRFRLLRLSMPVDEEAASKMASLERLKADLDAGRKSLEGVAQELSADLEELEWMTLRQLAENSPKLAHFTSEAAVGGHSVPFTSGGRLQIVRVLERREPEPLPFEQVRDQVLIAYLDRHGQRLYAELRREMLEGAAFRLLEDRFAELLDSGLVTGNGAS